MSLEGNGYSTCYDCGGAFSRGELLGGLCVRCDGRHDEDADDCACAECEYEALCEAEREEHPDLAESKSAGIDAAMDADTPALRDYLNRQYGPSPTKEAM